MPSAYAPDRILFVRPDTYGDLVLFEPVLRAARAAWPAAEVAVLVRAAYADIAPLMPEGVRWLTTRCEPYRRLPTDPAEAEPLAELRQTVEEFSPDLVVAAASSLTWLEFAVAVASPARAARVRLGAQALDPLAERALCELGMDAGDSFRRVETSPGAREAEKNSALAAALIGSGGALPAPQVRIPGEARVEAFEFLRAAGLQEGEFLAVAPAGTANIPIKSWPAKRFGALVAWAERERALPALLVGSREERARLEAARSAAAEEGARKTAVYTGDPGKIALLAALLGLSRAFVGNDTGALHLAAAADRPLVGVYGGGTWPRFLPDTRAAFAAVVHPLPCFGCGWDCIFDDAPCIQLLTPDLVRDTLAAVLDGSSPGVVEARVLDAPTLRRIAAVARRARQLESDGHQRLRRVGELAERLAAAEADQALRLGQIETLNARLRSAEEERAGNQQAHHRQSFALLEQVEALSRLLQASEAERPRHEAHAAGLLMQVGELTERLKAREKDHQAQTEQSAGLLAQVGELTERLKAREKDHQAQTEHSTGLLTQVGELTEHLKAREKDRQAQTEQSAALLAQVARLSELLSAREEEVARQHGHAAGLLEQLQALTALHQASEADRVARGRQIDELTAMIRPLLGKPESLAEAAAPPILEPVHP